MGRERVSSATEKYWDWWFGGNPSLDRRSLPQNVGPGGLPRCVGVDGRFTGGLKRFNGMTSLNLRNSYGNGDDAFPYAAGSWQPTYKFIRYVEMQKQDLARTIRGFVLAVKGDYDSELGTPKGGGTSTTDLVFVWYDATQSVGERWNYRNSASTTNGEALLIKQDVDPSTSLLDDIDVVSIGKTILVTGVGTSGAPITIFWDSVNAAESTGDLFTISSSVPDTGAIFADEELELTSDGTANTVNVLDTKFGGGVNFGTRSFLLRFKDSRRNVYSGVSKVFNINGGKLNYYSQIGFSTGNLTTDPSDYFDTMQIFCTLPSGSEFFLLHEESSWTGSQVTVLFNGETTSSGSADAGTDELLAAAAVYDAEIEQVGKPPKTNRIGHWDGVTVMRAEGSGSEEAVNDLLFSPTHTFQAENFPRNRIQRVPVSDQNVLQFLQVGGFQWGIGPIALYRFSRSGFKMDITRLHAGWGATSRNCTASFGHKMLIATRKGFLLVDAGTGDLAIISSLERLVLSDWAAELDGDLGKTPPVIQTAYDSGMGAVFILNTTSKSCAVLWVSTGMVSMLEDMPFGHLIQGVDVKDGGPQRAYFFLDEQGKAYHPLVNQSDGVQFTMGGDLLEGSGTAVVKGQVNGLANEAGSTTTLKAAGPFLEDMIGFFLHIVQGTTRTRAKITKISDQEITDGFTDLSAFTQYEPGAMSMSVSGGKAKATHSGSGAFGTAFAAMSTIASHKDVEITIEWTPLSTRATETRIIEVWYRKSGTGDTAGYVWYIVSGVDGAPDPESNLGTLTANTVYLYHYDGSTTYTPLGSVAYPSLGLFVSGLKTTMIRASVKGDVDAAGDAVHTLHLNKRIVASIKESTATIDAAGYVAFGATANHAAAVVENFDNFIMRSKFGTLTFDTTLATATASGDRFHIAPVPFRISGWKAEGNEGVDTDLLSRRSFFSMQASLSDLSRTVDTTFDKMVMQAFKGSDSVATVETIVSLDPDPAQLHGKVEASGSVLIPGWEIFNSDMALEMIGGHARGTIKPGQRTVG